MHQGWSQIKNQPQLWTNRPAASSCEQHKSYQPHRNQTYHFPFWNDFQEASWEELVKAVRASDSEACLDEFRDPIGTLSSSKKESDGATGQDYKAQRINSSFCEGWVVGQPWNFWINRWKYNIKASAKKLVPASERRENKRTKNPMRIKIWKHVPF